MLRVYLGVLSHWLYDFVDSIHEYTLPLAAPDDGFDMIAGLVQRWYD